MVRAPCCEKMGLKRGPWTYEEDRILITYINQNGHGNWRALPKRAGLMRCGKSCRLRWMNYLRPDIKRGNFTKIEEETIIKLHQELGNKWSVIAARLPGRTDNEIKNVWHTHLKKRLKLNNRVQHPPIPESEPLPETVPEYWIHSPDLKEAEYNWGSNSPATSSSDVSSASVAAAASDDFTETGFLKSWSEDFGGSEWSGQSAVEYENWCGSELGFEIGDDFGYGVLGNHIHTTNEFIELPEIWQ